MKALILTNSSAPHFLLGFLSTCFPQTNFATMKGLSSNKHDKHYSLETTSNQTSNKIVERRSGNYKPTAKWGFDFIQSLKSEYMGETYEGQANKLKEAVKHIFDNKEMATLSRLVLIDTIERLGVGYLFKTEIKRALDNMNTLKLGTDQEDLLATSLHFRLLRKHGYEVSQDVFIDFMKDETGNLKPNVDNNNVKGILSLYEASHLSLEGETILDEVKTFTTEQLNKIISEENNLSLELTKQVKHSLELPLHWRMLRLEAVWCIDNISMSKEAINPDLLELAKLDFNMVQAIYQNDLREMSSWWKDLGLSSELDFAREKLIEYFVWSVGMTSEPWFGNCRKSFTKFAALATTIDDVYDVYGSLDELELFTDVIERWDINEMEPLPHYMKICFLALYNTINGIAYDILIEKHLDILQYLKKAWADLCKAHLVEAKWYYYKYTPTFKEYMDNALVSVGGPLILIHAYVLVNQEISEEDLQFLESYPDLIRWTSTICRLCNDLGTYKDEIQRGDVPKSIHCFMEDNNVSEEVAIDQIRNIISQAWKKINKYVLPESSPFSKGFKETVVDLTRVVMFMYQYGNGFGIHDWETNKQVLALLVNPISLGIKCVNLK